MLENPYRKLENEALVVGLKNMADQERRMGANIILSLMVVLERKLYAVESDSLFTYCVRHLGFSKATAHRRSVVAAAAQRFPEVLTRLMDGRLHLCAAAVVAPYLDKNNSTEILDGVTGLSYREAEIYLVKRRAAVSPPAFGFNAGTISSPRDTNAQPEIFKPEPAKPLPSPLPRTVTRQVSAEAKRMNVTIHDLTYESFGRLKELMPGKSDDEIFRLAFDLLLEERDPIRRHARREAKVAEQRPPVARKLPPELKPSTRRRGLTRDRDAAVARSGGQCEHVGPSRIRCESRVYTELDHVRPFALGGGSSADDFRNLCFTHHRLRTEATFGPWRPRPQKGGESVPTLELS